MPSSELVSIGYRDLHIHDRHLEPKSKTMNVFVKIQLIFTDLEVNSLNQDMSRLLKDASNSGDVTVRCAQEREMKAHKCVLIARSPVFAEMLRGTDVLDLANIAEDVVRDLLRYLYTDHIDDLGANGPVLLGHAVRFDLPGLKTVCERYLADSIKPESVPSLLLLAEQFNCDSLKKAVMLYCEDHGNSIQKTMAWKVLEMVNPELFVEVCEAGLGSSISSNLDSDPDPNDPDLA
ncbi:UNVERIFIED_CONTAM: hypothetical protein PYX00_003168 [Menopon gallinae]|uniref:BTB domain-containing protein n=1 Tax=Menopon gallinae TaxID=328185 RepID=A0AAW2HZU2_9NEOP